MMMSPVARASGALAACLAIAAPAAAARPMTIQDLLSAVRVTDPQLSPDGRLVAFVRTWRFEPAQLASASRGTGRVERYSTQYASRSMLSNSRP